MKRFTGKKEDVYPLVLAVVGIILGWAVVVTRDLEGTLALVKWVLLAAFIAVAVTLIPLFLARLLWDRKPKTGTTPYFIQKKPEKRLTEIPDLTAILPEQAEFRLLFPEGTWETPPPEEFVDAWDASLGKVMKNDGLPYYTNDPAIMTYRADLFRELYEKPELEAILRRFAEKVPRGSFPDSLWRSLADCKARYDAIKTLREELNEADPRSPALRRLRDGLNEWAESDAGRKTDEAFAGLPGELFAVKSLTLAVNLDSGGHAHEAGIIALHGEPFGAEPAVPLCRPDPERPDLTEALNRELMNCVDRVLAEELTRTRADLEGLRRTAISDTLAGEIRFAAEFAGMLREMEKGGADRSFADLLRVFSCEIRT